MSLPHIPQVVRHHFCFFDKSRQAWEVGASLVSFFGATGYSSPFSLALHGASVVANGILLSVCGIQAIDVSDACGRY